MQKNIITIVGARPQFIKAGVVSHGLKKAGFKEIIVHTGQHYDPNMSDVFFNELEIPREDYNLQSGSGSHGQQTGSMIIALEKVILEQERLPDYMIVYGDTNSTLAGAVVASKLHIPIIHIEAGLRSFNRRMPEEVNRIMTDHVSSFLFCPSQIAVQHLKNEGVTKNVYNVGDVMSDALLFASSKIKNEAAVLERFAIHSKNYLISTIHRAENTDNIANLSNIFEAFEAYNKQIILALHPRTKKVIADNSLHIPQNVTIIEPLGYIDMIVMMKNAEKIITDSGGIQKEAYWLDVPCITMREETEWVETVEQNRNILTGADKEKISFALNQWKPNSAYANLYNAGKAVQGIIEVLQQTN